MRELQQLLKRFLSREIGIEELQRRFAVLLEQDSDLAARAAAWLDAGEQDGMLSATVCNSLKNVLVSHLAAIADGPDPRDSGVFGPDDDGPEDVKATAASPAPDAGPAVPVVTPSQPDAQPPPTMLARKPTAGSASQSDRTLLSTEYFPLGNASQTKVATRLPARVDTVLRIGSVVGERYELVSHIGNGGMGTVFKARDLLREAAQDRRPFVALKVLSEKFKEHPDSMIALQREARRAQSLAHPNVITVHEFFKDGPHFYMTMELLDGHPLDHLVSTKLRGGVSLADAWPVIEGVGKALQYGHEQGIVHSDIKPGNIFVCSNEVVKVLDFGISRPIPLTSAPEGEQTVFDARKRLGSLTPSYASLEMWYQDTPDPRDDIYSLACVCYVLLGGQHPFEGRSAKVAFEKGLRPRRIKSLTRGQWSAINRGLALHRNDRIASVTELLEELAPATADRSRRRLVALAGGLVLAIVLAAGVRYFGSIPEDFDEPLFPPMPTEPVTLTAQQERELSDLIELARLHFQMIDATATADELDFLLTHGPNSVMQLVDSARNINPYDEAALAMRKAVFDLYETRATEYYERRDYESAFKMAINAQEISDQRGIRRLLRSICDRAPDSCQSE
ncbi:MAG: serine/threonine-protein kinase [Pseudomonadota bacterium]